MANRSTATFGAVLSRMLATRGFSRSDLARALDVAPATIARWMSGSRTPNAESVTRVTQVLKLQDDDPERLLLFRTVGLDPDLVRAGAILLDPNADPAVQQCLRLMIRIGASFSERGVPGEILGLLGRGRAIDPDPHAPARPSQRQPPQPGVDLTDS